MDVGLIMLSGYSLGLAIVSGGCGMESMEAKSHRMDGGGHGGCSVDRGTGD
jgi:hypothetical protein